MPSGKDVYLAALDDARRSVEVMRLEARVAPAFLAMPDIYREGWLDALDLVVGVLARAAKTIEETL